MSVVILNYLHGRNIERSNKRRVTFISFLKTIEIRTARVSNTITFTLLTKFYARATLLMIFFMDIRSKPLFPRVVRTYVLKSLYTQWKIGCVLFFC